MAKLRVGDILIEDGDVNIGGHQLTQAPKSGSLSTESGTDSFSWLFWLREVPIAARVMGWVGAGLAVLGFGLTLAALPWIDPIGAIVRGGFLIPVGAGLIAAAFLKERMRLGTFDLNRLALGAAAEQAMERVRSALKTKGRQQTIEWIQQRAGLDEIIVVRALAVLRDRGELVEELDTDSGDFYYHLAALSSQDLNARLESINQRRHV